MSSGITWVAKTARPAFGVWRISKIEDTGAPAGRLDDRSLVEGSLGGAEDLEDGIESLEAEVRLSISSIAITAL